MTALNNLLFKVSMLDAMSGPAKGMMRNMDTVTTKIQGGFNKIGYGAAGLMGAGYSLDHILQPAKEMQTALGTVHSLMLSNADGGKQVLDNLNSTALKFTTQYGGNAAEFVQSAYQIQSAISGLSGNELPAFTNASAILAKATKADMNTITNYVGEMYQVFQKDADAMGKANWITKMAGQTATAVNIFKVEGQGMADAFANLGTNAAGAGIAMDEQMAILGTLTSSMKGGAEAGTAYRSFLDKVVKSQKDLGLNFLDSQNHMLPMIDILTKIKGKYGDLSDQTKKSTVSKAFGESPEAMGLITRLIGNIDGLSASIAQVGDQNGWQSAIAMANAMTQPWERASASANALRIVIGEKMLVVMEPLYNKITAVSQTLLRWSELFPNITRYIGYAVLGIIGIIAALSALSIVVGVFTLLGIVITSPITAIMAMGYAIYRLLDIWAQWTYGMSIFDTMAAGYEAAKLGVVSMIETTVAAFTGLKNWFNNFNLWESLLSGADKLIGLLNKIPGINIDLGGAANSAQQSLNKINAPAAVTGPQTASPSLSALAAQPQWLQQPVPGLLTGGFTQTQPVVAPAAPAALSQSQTANVPKGGIMSQINNANNSKSVNVGGITINNPSKPVTGQFLADELQMAAG